MAAKKYNNNLVKDVLLIIALLWVIFSVILWLL